jgi:hypothetical protein
VECCCYTIKTLGDEDEIPSLGSGVDVLDHSNLLGALVRHDHAGGGAMKPVSLGDPCRICERPLTYLFTVVYDGGEKMIICECGAVHPVTVSKATQHPINEWTPVEGKFTLEQVPLRTGFVGQLSGSDDLRSEW